MNLNYAIPELVGFVFALVRVSSWMVISPPFNNRMIPRRVKIATAAAISLPLALTFPADRASLDMGYVVSQLFLQMATGLMLGFLTFVLFSAVQTAGAMIDLFGGFTLSQSFDPFGNNQNSIFGRFHQLLGLTLFMILNGHLLLIKGFMTSYDVVPLDGLHIQGFSDLLLRAVASMGIAALEIAGPLLAAFFLSEVAMGLLTKAAPQLQILQFGFPLKILVTILLMSAALPILPGAIDRMTDDIVRSGTRFMRFGASGGG